MSFQTLGLSQPVLQALAAKQYSQATPIQTQAIPTLLKGRDLLGIAQTGTGKTAAFVLPILQRLAARPERAAPRTSRVLILTPTRELAIQIGASIAAYGRHLKLRRAVIYGGVGQGPQVKAMAGGVDLLVATPGRLLDLIGQGHADLSRVEALVLDEADRLLDMGFIRDVRRIVRMTPAARQSLLFSATMPGEVAVLANEMLERPVRVDVSPKVVAVGAGAVALRIRERAAEAKVPIVEAKPLARALWRASSGQLTRPGRPARRPAAASSSAGP